MSSDINVQLKEAKKLYDSKKYDESLKLYKQLYTESSEEFTLNALISYCWAIYQIHVKNPIDETELFENVEFITDLISQNDLNKFNTCPYTFSVFKVLDRIYREKEYYNLFFWLDKINPDLLDEDRSNFKGRIYRSRKEKYYDYASKAYLECADWQLCIDVSKEALDLLIEFTNNSDIWYNWRIAKSLKELNQHENALDYLFEVVSVKKDWFVFKEIAENYYVLNDNENALNNVCSAILTRDPINLKVNLYYLAYNLLKEPNPDIALKHIELYYLLKLDNNAEIAEDIEDLEIDEEQLNKKELTKEINDFWQSFKYQNQELKYGTITAYFDDKNYGFIKMDNYESIFFHENEFKGQDIYIGQLVSFYTEESFDKSKNENSLKAVNIRGE